MAELLALDPGECTGAAKFHDGRLDWCCALSLADELHARVDQLVIEIPNAHESKGKDRSRRDPQAIITLAITCGQWIRHVNAPDTVRLFPSVWKGQVPKPIHNQRVLACLQADELAQFAACTKGLPISKLHNVIDAVGLGLFQLGRMTRGRSAT